ncbi:hypothetical protein PV08_02945 [Exophiala spinifera]|uniref:Anaphase-promoting complex subunit 4 WD40 domain-containing protein n=1 Tax=Exophiala spinifera TaxID=91928 RepID=A0A0D1YTS4_9EURO|nr:uncharacterized protein PV08_02945 [Exophiala spinifera]KIW18656.1 hypothetical protein PV08_02945 [Exophiala spinifera]
MFQPKCVASTAAQVSEKSVCDDKVQESPTERFWRSLQWTADGTSLIASLADNSIQTFVVPPDLLDEDQQPHHLSPYCIIPAKEAVNAIAAYPFFDLSNPSTALVLSSMRDHPVRLNSAFSGHLGASYPLINPMTEVYICPHSLHFTPQGDRFIAGSDSLLSVYDLSRPGQEPISSIQTGPKRRTSECNPTTSMRGIVSALAVDPASGLLAAGTFGRQIGLYAGMGQGECVGVFSTRGTAADDQISGSGITQVAWSQDGRYLYIAERKSDGVVIYDIRKTGQLLSWLVGRNAHTNQRVSIALTRINDENLLEVWGGGVDGDMLFQEPRYTTEVPFWQQLLASVILVQTLVKRSLQTN